MALVRFCSVRLLCRHRRGLHLDRLRDALVRWGIVAGRGWIVVALVVFGTWRAGRIAIGAYLFGAATLAGLLVQSTGVAIPSQLLPSVPYVVTIVAISLLSMNPKRVRLNAPVSLGQVYHEAK